MYFRISFKIEMEKNIKTKGTTKLWKWALIIFLLSLVYGFLTSAYKIDGFFYSKECSVKLLIKYNRDAVFEFENGSVVYGTVEYKGLSIFPERSYYFKGENGENWKIDSNGNSEHGIGVFIAGSPCIFTSVEGR
jgi:hypothetical protein